MGYISICDGRQIFSNLMHVSSHDTIKRNCFVLRIRLRFKPRKFSACVSMYDLVSSYYDISREGGQKIGSVVDR